MSHDVVLDESASWYLPSTLDLNFDPSFDDEVSEAEMPPDEPEIGTRYRVDMRVRMLLQRDYRGLRLGRTFKVIETTRMCSLS